MKKKWIQYLMGVIVVCGSIGAQNTAFGALSSDYDEFVQDADSYDD